MVVLFSIPTMTDLIKGVLGFSLDTLLGYEIARRLRYRTENTLALDSRFSPTQKYYVRSTLGKMEFEDIGHVLLRAAQSRRHFVAIPVDSKVFDGYVNSGSDPFALSNLRYLLGPIQEKVTANRDFIPSMKREGFLISEQVGPIEVVSPSGLMCQSMYGQK